MPSFTDKTEFCVNTNFIILNKCILRNFDSSDIYVWLSMKKPLNINGRRTKSALFFLVLTSYTRPALGK